MDAVTPRVERVPDDVPASRRQQRRSDIRPSDLRAEGEPWTWVLGGALALGIVMVLGLLVLVVWNGAITFWPKPIEVVTLADGSRIAGEPTRSQAFRPGPQVLAPLPEARRAEIAANGGLAERTLYRTGNYDLYGDDFRWVADFERSGTERPHDMVLVERLEWGVFVGRILAFTRDDVRTDVADPRMPALLAAHAAARALGPNPGHRTR